MQKMNRLFVYLIVPKKLKTKILVCIALIHSYLIWGICGHAASGETYFCKKLQGLKITEKTQPLMIQPFDLMWLDDSVKIENGPIFNSYKYDLVYQSKNSFTASNSTLSAVIRFSETQNDAYLSFTFSTPFSVTAATAQCNKISIN